MRRAGSVRVLAGALMGIAGVVIAAGGFGSSMQESAARADQKRISVAPPAAAVALAGAARASRDQTVAVPAVVANARRQRRSGLAAVAGRTIVIDPGHNPGNAAHASRINQLVFAGVPTGNGYKACDTTGTQTADGYTEAVYNWDVASRLVRILRAAGARVILTRTATRPAWGPCIDRRAEIGNVWRAAAAVSIHADGGPVAGRGFALIAPAGPLEATGLTTRMVAADVALARALRTAYRQGTPMPVSTYLGQNGIFRSNAYGGTNLSHVPKVFIETGNMQNPTDARLLESVAFRIRAARALAVGIAAFIGR